MLREIAGFLLTRWALRCLRRWRFTHATQYLRKKLNIQFFHKLIIRAK